MKVVINSCYGGFSLSKEGMKRYCEIKGIPYWIEEDKKFSSFSLFTVWTIPPEQRPESKEGEAFYAMSLEDRKAYNESYSKNTIYYGNLDRHDPILVQVVEENAELASGRSAELKVVEIPDDINYQIEEYDGLEHVAEVHRTWG